MKMMVKENPKLQLQSRKNKSSLQRKPLQTAVKNNLDLLYKSIKFTKGDRNEKT